MTVERNIAVKNRCPIVHVVVLSLLFLGAIGCEQGSSSTRSYSTEAVYNDAVWAISTTISNLYNQNIAGTRTGNKNITVAGQGGGTVTIAGVTSFSQSTGISSVTLTYSFNGYSAVVSSGELAVGINSMTGVITEQGSWRTATILQNGYKNATYVSPSLAVSASLTRSGLSGAVDALGAYGVTVAFTSTTSESSGTTSGTFAGQQISW